MDEINKVNPEVDQKPEAMVDSGHPVSLEDRYKEDRAVYERIAQSSRNISIELAFEILERVRLWQQAAQNQSLEAYFKGLTHGVGNSLEWSTASLKQAYYVAQAFPHLKEKKDGQLKFSAYREIATARLTAEQKQEICQKAETAVLENKSLKFSAIRAMREEYQGKEPKEKQSKRIIFQDIKECMEKIEQFLSGRTDIKEGSKITITIRTVKGNENVNPEITNNAN